MKATPSYNRKHFGLRWQSAVQVLALIVSVCIPTTALAATNDLTGALQRGLFEEEANRNLDAAAQAYQSVSTQFDKDRALAATAIFRLGEIYRKQNKTNEAAAQYERIVREFSDQSTLVTLSRQNLVGLQAAPKFPPSQPTMSAPGGVTKLESLRAELALLRAQLDQGREETNLWVVARLFSIPGDEVGLFGVGNAAQHQGMLAYQDRRIRSLESVIAQSQSENQNNVLASTADAELLAKLKGLSKRELRDVLPSISGDKILIDLINELNAADQKFKSLGQDVTEKHPDFIRITEQQKLLNEKIDGRVNGIMKAMEIRVSAALPPNSSLAATTDEEEKEIRRIQVMIKDSPDLINAKGAAGGQTPLHNAAAMGQLNVARFLLANGADVGARDRQWGGRTPLQYAAGAGNKAMVELLLTHKADVNSADNTGNTALHLAVVNGFRSVVEVLVASGANVNAQRKTGVTPLHLAVINGYQNMVELLLKLKADPNVNSTEFLTPVGGNLSFGGTPLHMAVGRRDQALIELLLKYQAEINARDNWSNTPLHSAVTTDSTNVVALLLAKGAGVNLTNQQGTAPLLIAIERQQSPIARLLLEHKANPDAPGMFSRREPPGTMTSSCNYPLRAAVQLRSLELLTLLLEHGANPNTDGNCQGGTLGPPLWVAVTNPNEDAVKLLLQFKANPNSERLDFKPLIEATARGSQGIVELLLKAGADPNAANKQGWTALHAAVLNRDPEIAEMLLVAGADPNVPDSSGQAPLDMLKQPAPPRFPPNPAPNQTIPAPPGKPQTAISAVLPA